MMRLRGLVMVAGLLMAPFLASCTDREACDPLEDRATRADLLETIRPEIEFTRSWDGFTYTMDMHMELYRITFSDCKGTYRIVSDPLPPPPGQALSAEKTTYTIDRSRGRIINILIE